MSGFYYSVESSSSSEEDERDTLTFCGSKEQIEGIPCKNPRCDQEIVEVNQKDHYCSRECYHLKKERDGLGLIGDTGIKLKRLTIQGQGGTGLLQNPNLLDHLKICVTEGQGRVVTVNYPFIIIYQVN